MIWDDSKLMILYSPHFPIPGLRSVVHMNDLITEQAFGDDWGQITHAAACKGLKELGED